MDNIIKHSREGFKHYTESWYEKSETFTVEVKHWISYGSFENGEFNEEKITNHWNVYLHVFPKHPFFDKFKEQYNNEPFLDTLHYGCTYFKFDRDASGKIMAKHFGSDYQHLHDEHYESVNNPKNAREVFFDAECLYNDFAEAENELKEKE